MHRPVFAATFLPQQSRRLDSQCRYEHHALYPYGGRFRPGNLRRRFCERTTLRRAWLALAQDHNKKIDDAALFRPGACAASWFQSRWRDPLVPRSCATRSAMRHGTLGHRAGCRTAHQLSSCAPPMAELAWKELILAKQNASNASDVERALIDALSKRYAYPQPKDRAPLDQAYADAMREVWKRFPKDVDVGALFAEAMMDLRPWNQWTAEGQPNPGTEEIIATLDAVVKLNPRHPFANHLYIPRRRSVATSRARHCRGRSPAQAPAKPRS